MPENENNTTAGESVILAPPRFALLKRDLEYSGLLFLSSVSFMDIVNY